jgi:hypothetical protein
MKIEQENPIFIDSPSPKTGHFVEYWRFLFFIYDPYPSQFGCVILTTVI